MTATVSNRQDAFFISLACQEKLQRLVDFLLQEEGRPQELEVNIVLVDNSYISQLNASYRSQSGPTDVLSFNLQGEMPGLEAEDDLVLGDVFISTEKAAQQAAERGENLEQEIVFLAAHGVLHLLGYGHDSQTAEEKMQGKIKRVLAHLQASS
jgi:probable rRNA maturation factor